MKRKIVLVAGAAGALNAFGCSEAADLSERVDHARQAESDEDSMGNETSADTMESDSAEPPPTPEVCAAIQRRYGVRPRRYAGFFNDDQTEGERRFLAALPGVTDFINQRIAANGFNFRVTESEISANFLSEGPARWLADPAQWRGQGTLLESMSSYDAFGTDSLYDNRDLLRQWLPPAVFDKVNSSTTSQIANEQHQPLHDVALSLEEGLAANAALYASSKAAFSRTVGDVGALALADQFFWSALYFNAGPGAGRRLLEEHGVEWASAPWTSSFEPSKNARFNALLRTATFECLRRQVRFPDEAIQGGGSALACNDSCVPTCIGTYNECGHWCPPNVPNVCENSTDGYYNSCGTYCAPMIARRVDACHVGDESGAISNANGQCYPCSEWMAYCFSGPGDEDCEAVTNICFC